MNGPSAQERAYDEVPFPHEPRFWSEPAYIAAAAAMFGHTPPEIAGARILEIGCASGGNLLPMAARHPGAHFTGVDISSRQIATAQTRSREAGLTNVEFLYFDIAHGAESLGRFDYVIAHGVYSWIPEALQETLFELCAAVLDERGLLYMSYNTLPYWHMKAPMRDLLLLHAGTSDDQREAFRTSLHEARAIAADAPGIYGQMLNDELLYLEEQNPDYLLHEYFEAENHPVYVRNIIAQAQRHGLSYLSEATPTYSSLRMLKRSVAERIARSAGDDRALREQHTDFAVGRAFRRSIFSKAAAERRIPLDIVPAAIDELHILYMDLPPTIDYSDAGRELYYFDDALFALEQPDDMRDLRTLAEIAVARLAAILPTLAGTLPVRTALELFAEHTAGDSARVDIVRAAILEYFYQRKITFTSVPLSWAYDGSRPRAQPLVVSDARSGHAHTVNVLHETIELKSNNGRLLLSLLDGSRSRAELESAVLQLYELGEFTISRSDGAAEATTPVETVVRYLDEVLPRFGALRILTR